MLSQEVSNASKDLRALATIAGLQRRDHFAQMGTHHAQAGDIVIKRIEGRRLGDEADRLVVFGEHGLGIREQPRHVGVGGVERLGDLALVVEFQQVVHLLAAGVDVDLDAVPGGIIGRERRLGARDIALLQGGDGVGEGRPHRLDAGDLEALAIGGLTCPRRRSRGSPRPRMPSRRARAIQPGRACGHRGRTGTAGHIIEWRVMVSSPLPGLLARTLNFSNSVSPNATAGRSSPAKFGAGRRRFERDGYAEARRLEAIESDNAARPACQSLSKAIYIISIYRCWWHRRGKPRELRCPMRSGCRGLRRRRRSWPVGAKRSTNGGWRSPAPPGRAAAPVPSASSLK